MSKKNYPNYEKLREDLLDLVERYKKGEINLDNLHFEASDLDDEYFEEGDPEWTNNNIYTLYSSVLFLLDGFTSLLPENISIIEKALNCKNENGAECLKKWDEYWADKDPLKRRAEGTKRGYWEAED